MVLGIGRLVAAAVINGKVTSQSKRFDATSRRWNRLTYEPVCHGHPKEVLPQGRVPISLFQGEVGKTAFEILKKQR